MQSAAGEAAVRQMGIDGRQAEGQGFALLPHPGHEPAQLRHHGGAVLHHGMGGGLGHGAKPILSHVSGKTIFLANHGIFTVCSCLWILEQIRNNAKAELRATDILLSDQ